MWRRWDCFGTTSIKQLCRAFPLLPSTQTHTHTHSNTQASLVACSHEWYQLRDDFKTQLRHQKRNLREVSQWARVSVLMLTKRKKETKHHLNLCIHRLFGEACTATVCKMNQCTACTIEYVTNCRSQVDFTGKQKGLRWCQPSAIPWHPLQLLCNEQTSPL